MADSYLLLETGDRLLQETGFDILLETRSVGINGTDYSTVILLDSFSLTTCANRGEVGTGGFDVYDASSALLISAMKSLVLTEPQAFGNEQIFSGFTHDRNTTPLTDAALTARTWGVEVLDLNVLATDYVLSASDSADRGSETDYARIVWLLTTVFGTTGLVGSGVVPNSNTVTMEATDYRGRKPADVLAECSEASGKLWFIYDHGAGRKLYYDLATGTSLSSTAKISDTAGDPDGSTVFAVQGTPSLKRSPDRIYSKVHLTYNGGTVTVSNAGTATNYRAREAHVLDSTINNSTLATTKANAMLAGAASELLEIDGLSIVVAEAYVNDIRAGQRVQIKLARVGISSYTYYRVIRRTVQPWNTASGANYYLLTFGLASDVLASANGGRSGDDIWTNHGNANDDGATVIVDRGGITVTDGALTLTNSGATIVIDGESNMFKIAATGSTSVSCASGTTASTTITLSALGTWAYVPAHSAIHSPLGAGVSQIASGHDFDTTFAFPQYVASASGGSPTTKIVGFNQWAFTYAELNGSSQATLTCRVYNQQASGVTWYMRYYVLQELGL